MPKGFHVVCLEPGADNPKEHAPLPQPEPPEGFVDNTVYRYKLDEDGNKVLIGTMEAFPEGWNTPRFWIINPESGQRKKEDEEMARYNWAKLWSQVQELRTEGKKIREIAEELEIDLLVLREKIYREEKAAAKKQTLTPEPVQVEDEVKEEDFTTANDEPIPYTVADELSPLASEGNRILVTAWEKITAVIDDPIALPLIKELIRQGVA